MKNSMCVILGVLAISAFSVTAQCQGAACLATGDDGFRIIPCCTPVTPNVAPVVNRNFIGQYWILRNCAVEHIYQVQVSIQPTTWAYQCGGPTPPEEFAAYVSVTGPGFLLDCQSVNFRYSRTYFVPNPDGFGDVQVWRYLVNADFEFQSGTGPQPVPACDTLAGGPYDRVWFKGMFEYACRRTNKAPEEFYTLALSHHDGCIDHPATPLNARGLPLGNVRRHDDRSFHIVAPANFTFLAAIPMAGAVDIPASNQDSIRSNGGLNTFGFPYCLSEIQVNSVTLYEPNSPNCNCVSGGALWHDQVLNGSVGGSCVSNPNFGSLSIPGGLPTGFAQEYLGQWNPTVPYSFPGKEALYANVGIISYVDSCNTSTVAEMTYGNTTVCSDQTVRLYHDPLVPYYLMTDFHDQWISSGGGWIIQWGMQGRSEVVFQFSY